jgi:cellulose synthase/poly-beta-1,6-N-acetylglucosamine synthase-like glycosyltransferase
MTLPATSVVVPAFDAAATIEECLESLLALRYDGPHEVVVVDNGSRDGTRAILGRYSGRIRVVDEPRRGPAAARNRGVRETDGEVVAFTDADALVAPEWLRRLVEPLSDPRVGVAGGRILARPGGNGAERFGETIHDHHAALCVWRPPYAITMNWASRRTVLEEAGLFDESLRRCEDVDLSYRIGAAGYAFAYCPDAIVYHRNERSLLGLFREGWQHGHYAVPVVERHAGYVAQAREEGAPAAPPRASSRYSRAFETGKRLGRRTGRVRRLRSRAAPPSRASRR